MTLLQGFCTAKRGVEWHRSGVAHRHAGGGQMAASVGMLAEE